MWDYSSRFHKGSDTYEGDSDADLASRSTSDMKDLGQFQEGWLCAFTGKVEQCSHLRVANDEFKFKDNRAAKITPAMSMDVACNCHRYVFQGCSPMCVFVPDKPVMGHTFHLRQV